MASTSLRNAALRYAARGWYIIPLAPGSKRPSFTLLPPRDPSKPRDPKTNPPTYKLFGKTPATPEQIKSWWSQEPDANIGILCGYTPGLLVVDLDPNKKDSNEEYKLDEERRRVLLDREGFEATPLVVKTTSGGWHLYYRHPRAPTPVVSQTTHTKGAGVDVQSGALAYVVAPPSIYRKKRYRWVGDETAEPPAPPPWVIAPQDTSDTRVYTGSWFSLALQTPLLEGGNDGGAGRNRTLRSLALSMAKRGIEMDRATAHLSNWNTLHCKPPLTDVEIFRQISHMYEKAASDIGADGSDSIRLRYNGPAFPLHVLRTAAPRLYRWVETMVTRRKCHPDMVASAAILALGTCTTHYRIIIDGVDEWKPPAHTWGTIVADSGTKKSVVFDAIKSALQPTRDVLATIASVWNAEIQTERDMLEQTKRDAKTAHARAKTFEQRGAARDLLAQANRDLADLPKELHVSWITSDTTPEAFQEKMAALGWVGLLSEEGADVLKGFFGHYSGKVDISGVLKGYDGGSTDIDRKSTGHTSIDRALATMLIFTQPSVLSDLSSTEAEDRGFLARMQFCIPSTEPRNMPLSSVTVDPAEVYADFDVMVRGTYFGGRAAHLRAVEDSTTYRPDFIALDVIDMAAFDEDDEDKPRKKGRPPKPMIVPDRRKLTPPQLREEIEINIPAEVWALIVHFQTEMGEVSQPGAQHYGARSWCKKAGEHAMRIAVVLELAESSGEARELTAVKASAAIQVVRDYFLAQYYVAVDRMARPRVADMAIHVLRRFRDAESFTTSQLADDLRCATEDAVELCHWLADRGAIASKGRGRNLVCKVLPGVDY